ncbi:MAG: hypothetical protein Q8P92_02310 [Candidatus Daviesbacteria bacterium]|nr:hypothetical protein [Candidatus Daviesbacteria bacterium]
MEKLRFWFSTHKVTAILGILIILALGGGIFAFQKISTKPSGLAQEVDLIFDAEGPYALTIPRNDGNAMILNLKRTSSYDEISYELAYTSEAEKVAERGGKVLEEGEEGGVIERGVVGTINTTDRKGEYEQEILFGTCSKNVCKYDQGVENGTLTLRIKKGNNVYKMVTQWHLQRPDIALGKLSSGDEHFKYEIDTDRETLSGVGYSIVNDLTGVPKLPSEKEVLGKVYALNVPIAKDLPTGQVTYELAQDSPEGAKIYVFYESTNEWQELDTKVEGSKLSAAANGSGIFAVLVPQK